MKVVTITGEFINTIPTQDNRPGRLMGVTRDGFMKNLFSLATAYGHEIRVAGQHWDYSYDIPLTDAARRMADDRLSRHDIKRRNDAFNKYLAARGHK